MAKKYFLASPESVRRSWIGLGSLCLIFGVLLFAAAAQGALPLSLSMPLALAASGPIILAFARVMPRKTFKGASARLKVLGFQEFLERAEKGHLESLPPDTLHKWLAYAIALGVEEAWIASFEGMAVDAPAWYESGTPFTISGYSSSVRSFGRETQHAWLTSARGSGGSSWGGGGSGFSGGGSGGGGGGGGGGTF